MIFRRHSGYVGAFFWSPSSWYDNCDTAACFLRFYGEADSAIAAGVMLAESDNLVRPLPGLLDGLNRADCNRLRAIGREKALEAGQLVWSQGDAQAGRRLFDRERKRGLGSAGAA